MNRLFMLETKIGPKICGKRAVRFPDFLLMSNVMTFFSFLCLFFFLIYLLFRLFLFRVFQCSNHATVVSFDEIQRITFLFLFYPPLRQKAGGCCSLSDFYALFPFFF